MAKAKATTRGQAQVADRLRRMAARAGNAKAQVQYLQDYAIYVHEDLEAHHPVGQAKYLSQPAKDMRKELAATVGTTIARGGTTEEGLYRAGLKLQRASQKLVPGDTGALKNSARTVIVPLGS
jgi:hypothetical protein